MGNINEIQKIAAEKEYKKLKAEGPGSRIFALIFFLILAFSSLWIFEGYWKIGAFLFWIFCCSLSVRELNERKKRMDYLKNNN